METKKKTNGLTRALAVILAVVLVLGGGTFAYLTDSSVEKVNEFDTNYNGVELEESEGDYEIVPGTSQDKDPVITATYTLASYVYVEVTDATDDLVEWYIANGWTELEEAADADAGVTVYYMLLKENYDSTSGDWEEVTSGEYEGWYSYEDSNGVTYYYDPDTEQYVAVIHVLEDDKVYYPSTITNDDMENAGDISLTFQAYIMQAEPFLSGNATEYDGAYTAYYTMLSASGVAVNYEELGVTALVNGQFYSDLTSAMSAALSTEGTTTVELVTDADLDGTLLLALDSNSGLTSTSVVLDLNGYTIEYTGDGTSATSGSSLIRVAEGVTLTITGDGVIDGSDMTDANELIWARGGTVIIESGTFILDSTQEACVYASKPTDSGIAGTVEIYGGTFINNGDYYAYGSTLSALTLNVLNGNPGSITVYGGVFYGNDPANGDDNCGGTFVADGYTSTAVTEGNTTFYVVTVAEGASEVTLDVNTEALTLSEAITAAATLASDNSSTEVTIVVSSGTHELLSDDSSASIIPAGTTITGSGTDETILTIDCNSTVGGSKTGDGYTISTENVTISNLTIQCTNMGTTAADSALNITASGTVLDNVSITGGTQATYTASIYINGGNDEDFMFTIKNSTIDNSSKAPFRAIYVNNLAGTLYIENCTLDAVYPLNINSASTTAKVYFTDSTLHGWTSYTANVALVTFTNCTFSKGTGANTYDCVAAYTNTTFEDCTFDSDFVVYAQKTGFTWNFNNCTKDGTAVTAENFTTLFPTDSDVWTNCSCYVNSTQVTE